MTSISGERFAIRPSRPAAAARLLPMEGGEPGPDRRQQSAPARAGTHGRSPAAASTPPRIPAGPPAAPRDQHQPPQQQPPRLDRLSPPVMIAAAVFPRRQIRLTCTNRPHGHELPLPCWWREGRLHTVSTVTAFGLHLAVLSFCGCQSHGCSGARRREGDGQMPTSKINGVGLAYETSGAGNSSSAWPFTSLRIETEPTP